MPALTLLIIRHAEKPGENWPGPGLTIEGTPDDKSLVIRGWQRAGAWAALFGAGLGGTDYPAPAAIYAANPAGSDQPAAVRDDHRAVRHGSASRRTRPTRPARRTGW